MQYAFNTSLEKKAAMAICPDGKIRKVRLNEPDTMFSIPGNTTVKRKTVSGFVIVETINGFSTETYDDPLVVKFIPYIYGKNATVFQ